MGESLALRPDARPCLHPPSPDACAQAAHMREAMQRLRSFNRSLSHDLRGPLGAVSGATRLAIQAIERSDTPSALRLLLATAHNTDALTRLVTELLALAEADQLVDDVVDLQFAAQDAIAQLALTRLGHDMPAIHIDPLFIVRGSCGLLRQVFVNLLDNALKFTRDVAAPRIEVGTVATTDGPAIAVRDNGIGFDATKAAHLFEPFRRLHGSSHPGHGVGLSVVKRIVERHGGRVWVESSPGAGAVFYFTLAHIE